VPSTHPYGFDAHPSSMRVRGSRQLRTAGGRCDHPQPNQPKTNRGVPFTHLARLILLVWAAVALCGQPPAPADSGPQPPCGTDSFPAYPDLDHSPVVRVWDRSDLGRNWIPPACTGWSAPGFSTLAVAVGRFRDPSGAEGLLRRIGAVSQLAGMRYWSTTHKRWETLVLDSSAVAGPAAGLAVAGMANVRHREDFSSNEISEGRSVYFQQSDNLSGRATYRLRVTSVSPERLVFETENVSTLRYLLVPLFQPGEIQSIYFLQLESPGVWCYYNIMRIGMNASRLATGHDASSINRAVAFFRHWAGIPTDQEPPAAR
jgi:hypothetical protein